jgi:hypothetical protein
MLSASVSVALYVVTSGTSRTFCGNLRGSSCLSTLTTQYEVAGTSRLALTVACRMSHATAQPAHNRLQTQLLLLHKTAHWGWHESGQNRVSSHMTMTDVLLNVSILHQCGVCA